MPLADALAAHADVCLLLPAHERALFDGELDRSVELVTFTKPRLRQPLRQLQLTRMLLRAIHRFEPDVVHIQQGHLWFNFGLRALRRYPLVVTVHDHTAHVGDRGGARTPQRVMDIATRRADRVIVHSEQLKREIVALRNLRPDRVDSIPLVVVTDARPPVGVAEEPSTILFFGRIWPYKGLDYLIRAEPLMAAEYPDLRIVVAGEGEPLERYRELMTSPERYEVHNAFVSNAVRAELFARSSVVVLPYIEASQSAVVPIAYAFSKPVVATSVGGLPEVVVDGVTGLVIPPRDEAALARAVNDLLADPSRRHALGAAGKRKLETELSAAAVAEATVRVYKRVLGERLGEPHSRAA